MNSHNLQQDDNEKLLHALAGLGGSIRMLQGSLLFGHTHLDNKAITNYVNNVKASIQELKKGEIVHDIFDNLKAKLFAFQSKENIQLTNETYGYLEKPDLKDMEILIIDDKWRANLWRNTFSAIFGINSILGAENFASALRNCKENNKTIALILCDISFENEQDTPIEFRKKEGLLLIEELSRLYPEIPIVAFSSHDSLVLAKQALERGAWSYFAKEPEMILVEEKKPEVFYKNFYQIVDACIKYHKEYRYYWAKLEKLNNSLSQVDKNGYALFIINNLRTSLRYIVLSASSVLMPGNKINEFQVAIIALCSRSLDALCSMLINIESPNSIPENVRGLMWGKKIEILRNAPTYELLTSSWFDKIETLKDIRNMDTHPDEIIWRDGKRALQYHEISSYSDSVKKYIHETVSIIQTAVNAVKN
jgi:CheY-like chemotaxis protein